MAVEGDDKLRVQQATDIVELIGEHVALKSQGREFAGLCPFHEDSRPSMQVSPAKQIYKCFACGAGGDVFSFTMQYHRMAFVEAMKYLAERAGLELTPRRAATGQAGDDRSPRTAIAEANQQALKFYRQALLDPKQGQLVRDYLARRGISDEMIQRFQLGYAPDRWDALAQQVGKNHWRTNDFEQAGLIQQKKNGRGHIDRLRHRLIFPICDALGRPIAFGGRRLRDEDDPKYLNSPETALFDKSSTLYGLDQAKKPIIDSKTAVIVEGYTDVIACHQAGANNVIATLGTALTRQHVTHLRRYADKVVLLFDPDEAGQKAADRAAEIFLTGELDVAIAMLPDGLDPADLLAEANGYDRWQRTIDQAQDALDYQFQRIAQQLDQAGTVTARQRIAEQYIQRLAQLGLGKGTPPIRRSFVVQQVSQLLAMREDEVNALLSKASQAERAKPKSPPAGESAQPTQPAPQQAEPRSAGSPGHVSDEAEAAPSPRHQARRLAERQLIGGLVRDNALFHTALPDGTTLDEALASGDLSTDGHCRLYAQLYQTLAEGKSLTLAGWLGDLAAEHDHELIKIVTQADQDVDAATDGNDERLGEVVRLAAQAILREHEKWHYEQSKQSVLHERADPLSDDAGAQRLRDLIEHNREHPSPARIARLQQ